MLPEKRKAMMLTGIREMKEGVFDMPQWGPDDVLVRIASVGICGSDLVYYAKGGSTFAKSGSTDSKKRFAEFTLTAICFTQRQIFISTLIPPGVGGVKFSTIFTEVQIRSVDVSCPARTLQ